MKKLKFAIRYLTHKLFSGFHHLGWKVVFENNVVVRGTQHIHIGNYVTIDSNTMIYAVKSGVSQSTRPQIVIEDRAGISTGAVILAAKEVKIGKDAMVGPNTVIVDYDYHYENVETPIFDQGFNSIKPIRIGRGAWIGANVTICSGVTIGRNSVIGANSVVKDDIPDYSLAVGAPAKVVKQYSQKTKKWERVKS